MVKKVLGLIVIGLTLSFSSCLTRDRAASMEFGEAPLFGMVYDFDNQPCSDALIFIDDEEGPQTDINGRFVIDLDFVEMPEDMIKHHTSERLHKYQLDLINKGTPQEEIEKHSEDLKSASEESVVRDFKMSLVLEHIAEKERIFVTEDDVSRRISEMAGMYGLDAAGMKKQLEKMNSMSNLRHQLRESKTLNLLMKEANIEEVKEEVKKKTKAKAKQKEK